jgi:hypothetical protein
MSILKSKYTLSPQGNGIDCHRIYEAIYLNSIPIIKSGLMDNYFKKLPAIIINNWTDITEDFLKNEYNKLYLYSRTNKQLFSEPNRILIDDMKQTIDEWNAKGGIGIFHISAADTISQLKKLGL